MIQDFSSDLNIYITTKTDNRILERGTLEGGMDNNKNIYLHLRSDTINILHIFNESPQKIWDYFEALIQFRKLYPQYKLGLKGCLVNVWPSSMCRDMGNGLIAYYLNIGQPPTDDDIIHVFSKIDRNDFDSIASPIEQQQFYYKWLESL